jgi:hypothetical protein
MLRAAAAARAFDESTETDDFADMFTRQFAFGREASDRLNALTALNPDFFMGTAIEIVANM